MVMKKIVGSAKKGYVVVSKFIRAFVVVGILLNIAWNFYNSLTQARYELKTNSNIELLKLENIELKKANAYLVAENIKNYRNINKIPKATWKKKKMEDVFVYDYYNDTFWKQFLEPLKLPRYYLLGKTDFDLFTYENALRFKEQDHEALANPIPQHYEDDFYTPDSLLVRDGYVTWRELEDGNEFIWRIMDNFYMEKND